MTTGLRLPVTHCGTWKKQSIVMGMGVGRKIRENLMKTMAFALGVMNKISKNGELVQWNIF